VTIGSTFPTQYSSDEDSFNGEVLLEGFSLFDDLKAKVQTQVQSTIDKAKVQVTSVVGEQYTEKLGDLLEKQKDSLVQKGQDIVLAKAGDMINTKENQDSAITSGVQATAEKISQSLIDVKDTYRTSGITGLFNKYPVPFYVTGGLTALLVARFVLGGKKYVVRTNPRRKKSKKK
jgi:hypothetical protein